MREAKEWQALIREAARHGVEVTEGTAARGLGCWDSCLLRIGRHGQVTVQGANGRGTDEDREGWDPGTEEAWAELDGVRPLDLLHGFRLLGWKRARAWAVACWAELEGRESVLSIGPVGGWARAIAHLGRALTGWGDDFQG